MSASPSLGPRDTTFENDELGVGENPGRWPEPTPAETYMTTPPPKRNALITGLLCHMAKLVIIGASKSKKTWLANLLAYCLATGRNFIGWPIPTPRKVLYCNLELTEDAFHERSYKVTQNMGIKPSEVAGRLDFLHLRGKGLNIKNLITLPLGDYEVVIVDPVYKLFSEGMDENAAGNWADFLRTIDEIIQAHNCSTILVHHDPKSKAADLVNRGAGSGVLGRDADAGILLDPHADDPDALVVSSYARRFAPTEPFCIRWADGPFDLAPDLKAITDSPFQRKQKERRGADDDEVIRQILPSLSEPIAMDRMLSNLHGRHHLGEKRARRIVNLLIDGYGYTRTHAGKGRPAMLLPPGLGEKTEERGNDGAA
jgi:hypothetical protein